MAYWLLKSEPFKFSWEMLTKVAYEPWDGVRNYQASNNLKAMKLGEQCFFYHSNEGKEIVGICEVVKEYYPDDTDASGRFGRVDVAASKPLLQPVSLKNIKANPALQNMALVRQSRLSVCPITPEEWQIVCAMGGL